MVFSDFSHEPLDVRTVPVLGMIAYSIILQKVDVHQDFSLLTEALSVATATLRLLEKG